MVFHGFNHLIGHVAKLTAEMDAAVNAGLNVVASKLLADTREKFGEYQTGEGPFQTWPPLAQATKDRRLELGFSEDEPLLRTGDLRDSYYKAVGHMEAGVGSDEEKALAQEVGNPATNLPARSTLGLAFAEHEKKYFDATGEGIEALLITGAISRLYSSMVTRRP